MSMYWGRSLVLGQISFIVADVLVLVAVYMNILYFAAPAMLVSVLLFRYSTGVWKCLYPLAVKPNKLKKHLQSIFLYATLFGGLAAIMGGYFYRDYSASERGTTKAQVQTSVAAVGDSTTVVKFLDGNLPSKPQTATVGRALAWYGSSDYVIRHSLRDICPIFDVCFCVCHRGFWPTCVVPIQSTSGASNVFYWAAGHGACCVKNPPTCDDWGVEGLGGIEVKFTEFYPGLKEAISKAMTANNFVSPPNAPVYVYADVSKQKSNLQYRATVAFVCSYIIGNYHLCA